jgi:predicted ester cyclase
MGDFGMKRCAVVALLLAMFALPSLADDAKSVEVAKAMVGAINARSLEALDGLVSADVIRHSAATPGVVVTNLSEFRAFLESDFAIVPDSVMEIDIIFSSGDYVAMLARYMGTQTGPMGPFPASGKRFELPFIGILRLENDKIAEIWVEWDNVHALTQLGHFPQKEE